MYGPNNDTYQQVVLPLLGSEEFAADTLHIIAEPDFCFREADSLSRSQWAKSCISETLVMDRLRAIMSDEFQATDKLKQQISEIYQQRMKTLNGVVVSNNDKCWPTVVAHDTGIN